MSQIFPEGARPFDQRVDRSAWLRLAVVCVPLVLLVASAIWVWRDVETDAILQAKRITRHTAAHVSQTFSTGTSAMRLLDTAARGMSWEKIQRSEALVDLSQRVVDGRASISGLSLISPQHLMILSSRGLVDQPLPVADRDYATTSEGTMANPFVGARVSVKPDNIPGFTLSAPMTGPLPQGGRVVALFLNSTYEPFFADSVRGDGDAVGLIRDDGEILAGFPNVQLLGNVADLLSSQFVTRDDEWVRTVSKVDGETRYIVSHRVGDWPVRAVYALPKSALIGDFLALFLPVLAFCLASMVLLFWLTKQMQDARAGKRSRVIRAGAPEEETPSLQTLKQLSAIIANADKAIFSTSLDGLIDSWNPMAARLFGFQAEEALGKSCLMLVPTCKMQEQHRLTSAALRGESAYAETVRAHKSGTLVAVAISCCPVRDTAGTIVGIASFMRDLSDTLRAEAEIQDSQARLRRLMDANVFGVAVMDEFGTRDMNRAFRDLFGFTGSPARQELEAEALRKMLPTTHSMVERLRETGVYPPTEIEVVCTDGRSMILSVTLVRMSLAPLSWINVAVDVTERLNRERNLRETMMEVNHRSKNLLTVVNSIARQIARTSPNWSAFDERFGNRLSGLAAAQDVLINQQWRGANVRDLVRSQIAHVDDPSMSQTALDGPDVLIDPRSAQAIGMALHELSTNAAKYGALSTIDGVVHIRWKVDRAAEFPFSISWTESGGPPVTPPTRSGFGRVVVERMTVAAVGGTLRYEFLPGGVQWELRMSTDHLLGSKPMLRVVA